MPRADGPPFAHVGFPAAVAAHQRQVVFDCAPEIPAPSSQCTAEKNLNNFGSVKKMKAQWRMFFSWSLKMALPQNICDEHGTQTKHGSCREHELHLVSCGAGSVEDQRELRKSDWPNSDEPKTECRLLINKPPHMESLSNPNTALMDQKSQKSAQLSTPMSSWSTV